MIARYTRPEMGAIWSEERRYGTWLEVELAATDALAAAGVVGRVDPSVDEPNGWVRTELEIPGGDDAAADVVAALNRANIRVARCERLALSLADLLERTLRHFGRPADA